MNSSLRRVAMLVALLLTVPLIAAGCGGGDSSSEADSGEIEAATVAATDTLDALKRGNSKAVCRSLSPEYVEKQMGSIGECARGMDQLLEMAGDAMKGVSLDSNTVLDGDRGEVELVNGDGSEQGKMYLVREDGTWYSTLEASPADEDE